MILKSYEIQKNKSSVLKCNFFLMYGENLGLKKDIKEIIKNIIQNQSSDIEIISLYQDEILEDKQNFYDLIYSGSLFGSKKIITIHKGTDKIFNEISDIYSKYPESIYLIIFSDILEKKSKLRNFFEKEKKTICTPCYLDNERDLEIIAITELKKNNIKLPREAINLLIEKSNSDRDNLKNEITKIISYSLNKKTLDINEIKSLINFSGDYKSESFINECLCGNLKQYKKIISELYMGAINHILFLRILSSKTQRLLKIKEQNNLSNLDSLINACKPPIFWKEKPIVKQQLRIWDLRDLKRLMGEINNTELMCKKNPQISNAVFFNFFSDICKKANNIS